MTRRRRLTSAANTSTGPPRARRTALKLLGLGVASLGAVAIAGPFLRDERRSARSGPVASTGTDFWDRFASYEPAEEPDGDLSKVVWPAFVTRHGPEIQQMYAFQITNGELMKYMPCFCGCQNEDGHQNNRDCYVKAVNPDGSVVLDAMAPT
jgi:hypothetical protein